MLRSEAIAIIRDCWLDNGCQIDVDLHDEETNTWVATLWRHSSTVYAEQAVECIGESPMEAVERVWRWMLTDEPFLRKMERCT